MARREEEVSAFTKITTTRRQTAINPSQQQVSKECSITKEQNKKSLQIFKGQDYGNA